MLVASNGGSVDSGSSQLAYFSSQECACGVARIRVIAAATVSVVAIHGIDSHPNSCAICGSTGKRPTIDAMRVRSVARQGCRNWELSIMRINGGCRGARRFSSQATSRTREARAPRLPGRPGHQRLQLLGIPLGHQSVEDGRGPHVKDDC